MAPLPIEPSILVFLASALATAFLGGWHCAGMCAPIATLAIKKKSIFLYQVGRLFSYVTLGLLASVFGERLLGWIPADRRWILTLIIGLLSFWILMAVWKMDFAGRLQKFLWRNRPRGSFVVEYFSLGILNGLLPCHWLYGFVIVAAGLGNVPRAAALMFCLWLGSLPWLLPFSWLGAQFRFLSPQAKWIQKALLVAVLFGLLAQQFHAGLPHLH